MNDVFIVIEDFAHFDGNLCLFISLRQFPQMICYAAYADHRLDVQLCG